MTHTKETKKGLSLSEVRERKENGLENGNFSVHTKSVKRIIFDHVFTLFNFINLFLGGCLILVHSYKNMLFLGVVFWNMLIGIVQELRSKKMVDKLSLLSQPRAKVYRDGLKEEINLEEIVRDDLLILEAGSQVCVDVLVMSGSCEVNESFLTGESDPVLKHTGDEILSGSYLISGSVEAQAIHVGQESYVNKITSQAKYVKKQSSQLILSIKKIIKAVTILLIPVMVLLFANQVHLEHAGLRMAVIQTVAAVIGMIPSGLVLLTSVVLAVSVMRLAKRKTLVQEMYCIETLARVDVLCLDKTGTLTEGVMDMEGVDILNPRFSKEEFDEVLYFFTDGLKDNNPTFHAMEEYAKKYFETEKAKKSFQEKRDKYRMRSCIHFTSEKKWSLVDFEEQGCYCVGAPEFVIPGNREIEEYSRKFTEEGMRVLLLAHSSKHCDGRSLPEGLEPDALLLIADRIRKNAEKTLEYFKRQDVNIKIISGDNPCTVASIAKRVGLSQEPSYIDATELEDEDAIRRAVEKYQIFGRVTPMQKMRLVQVLQEKKHVVAMTGDGVNDVMALKEADCSIAMQSGSDAARNVSQIILTESDFSAMPHIVEEGRRTIHNIGRSASLYLTKTIYASVLAVLFIFLQKSFPFQPIHQTLIGGLAIGIPSFLLALEPNFERVRGDFMTQVLKKAIPGAVCVLAGVACAQVAGHLLQDSQAQVTTMAFYALVYASFTELVAVCLPFQKWRLLMCLGLILAFTGAVVVMGNFFEVAPLGRQHWMVLLGVFLFLPVLFAATGKAVQWIMNRHRK